MKYCVMQSLRTGMGHRDGLVKEMDPDAVNRDRAGGRGLAADDMVSYIALNVRILSQNLSLLLFVL